MKRNLILWVIFSAVTCGLWAQTPKKEYVTFSDTKGKVIDCRGKPGFQGATLTIQYPTLPAYQKQYSKRYLVLDPDPPANLTMEEGGFDGPCSRYEVKQLVLGGYPRLHGTAREFPEKMEVMYCKNGIYHYLAGVKNGRFFSVYLPDKTCTLDESLTQDLYGKIGKRPSPAAIDKLKAQRPQPAKMYVSTVFCGEDGKRYHMTIWREQTQPPNPLKMDFESTPLLNSCRADPSVDELAANRLMWPD